MPKNKKNLARRPVVEVKNPKGIAKVGEASAYETLCLALAAKIEKTDPTMNGLAGMVGKALAEESKNPQAVAQRHMAIQAAMFGGAAGLMGG